MVVVAAVVATVAAVAAVAHSARDTRMLTLVEAFESVLVDGGEVHKLQTVERGCCGWRVSNARTHLE